MKIDVNAMRPPLGTRPAVKDTDVHVAFLLIDTAGLWLLLEEVFFFFWTEVVGPF